MRYYWIEKTDYGFIGGVEEDEILTTVFLPQKKEIHLWKDGEKKRTPILREFLKSMKSYFNSKKFCDFSAFPVRLPLSPFRRKVYSFLKDNVKWGEVIIYKDLSTEIGVPYGFRAVGNALSLNQTPLVVPCHRVISKNGLGGFSYGLALKELMLKIEGVRT